MKSWLHITLFALTMLLYFFFPWHLIWQQERILSRGERAVFRLAPVDPIDVFRGRYLRLQFQWDPVPAADTFRIGQPVFVCLNKDSLGFSYPAMVYADKPVDCLYMRTKITSTGYPDENHVTVEIPNSLARYYMNESLAPLAEELYNQLLLINPDTSAVVPVSAWIRIRNGQARVEQLLFEEEPLPQYIRSRLEAEEAGMEGGKN